GGATGTTRTRTTSSRHSLPLVAQRERVVAAGLAWAHDHQMHRLAGRHRPVEPVLAAPRGDIEALSHPYGNDPDRRTAVVADQNAASGHARDLLPEHHRLGLLGAPVAAADRLRCHAR